MADGYGIVGPIISVGSTLASSGSGYSSLSKLRSIGYGGDYGISYISTLISSGSGGDKNYGSGRSLLASITCRGYGQLPRYGSGYSILAKIKSLGFGDYAQTGSGYSILEVIKSRGFSGNVTTLILNANTGEGPYPYSDFDFNSIFEVEGRIFMSSSSGLYELTGIDDNGTDINAYFESIQDDFGITGLKNVPEIFVSMTGRISIKTSHDEDYSSNHNLTNTNNKMITKRAKLGIGMRQEYWGLRISNISGSSFEIDKIEFPVMVQKRTVNQ